MLKAYHFASITLTGISSFITSYHKYRQGVQLFVKPWIFPRLKLPLFAYLMIIRQNRTITVRKLQSKMSLKTTSNATTIQTRETTLRVATLYKECNKKWNNNNKKHAPFRLKPESCQPDTGRPSESAPTFFSAKSTRGCFTALDVVLVYWHRAGVFNRPRVCLWTIDFLLAKLQQIRWNWWTVVNVFEPIGEGSFANDGGLNYQ